MNPAPPSLEATWSLEIISGQPRGAPDIQSSPHLLLMAWKPCCGPSASQFIISQTFTDRGILFTLLTSIIRLQSSTSLSTCVAAATCGNGFFHGQYSHLRLFTFSPRGVARGFCRSPKASPTIPWTLLTVSMVSHSFTLGSRSHQTFCQSLSTVSLSRWEESAGGSGGGGLRVTLLWWHLRKSIERQVCNICLSSKRYQPRISHGTYLESDMAVIERWKESPGGSGGLPPIDATKVCLQLTLFWYLPSIDVALVAREEIISEASLQYFSFLEENHQWY